MNRTIVIAFSTLDGIIEDPDGSGGTPNGGWAFRTVPRLSPGTSSGSVLSSRTGPCCSDGGPGSCSPTSGQAAPTTSLRP